MREQPERAMVRAYSGNTTDWSTVLLEPGTIALVRRSYYRYPAIAD